MFVQRNGVFGRSEVVDIIELEIKSGSLLPGVVFSRKWLDHALSCANSRVKGTLTSSIKFIALGKDRINLPNGAPNDS